MKFFTVILLCLLAFIPVTAQYYFRGEIKDEMNKPLANARILSHSSGYVYYAGGAGGFGITSGKISDSVTISFDGYQPRAVKLEDGHYENIVLKMLQSLGNVQKKRLISITRDMPWSEHQNWNVGGETYTNLLENEFIGAKKFPEAGFAISTDKASYSNVRRFLNMGSEVPPDAVRIEELMNYFNFGYSSPQSDSTFRFSFDLSSCPWNANAQLLFLRVCAEKVNLNAVPPSNLVFLIDVSGSMDMPNRLPLLKAAFKLMVNNLREKDTVSIVTYGSSVSISLRPTSGREKEKINKSIEELEAGGSTPGASAIATAYSLAKNQYINGGNNRVILATDGDFNVGETGEDALEKMISLHRESGIYLTCLGVGMGNYKDSKLEILAKKGNGNFAYLDSEHEAEKVLVKEFTQTLYAVADDACLSIRFNANWVKEYRLIGFDNKLNAIADSLSELEGGEVGSGHTMMAVFEIISTSQLSDVRNNLLTEKEQFAEVSINYKKSNKSKKNKSFFEIPFKFTEFDKLLPCNRFATSVIAFASLLKGSKYIKTFSWNDIMVLANESINKNDVAQVEFIALVEKAKKIYGKRKRR